MHRSGTAGPGRADEAPGRAREIQVEPALAQRLRGLPAGIPAARRPTRRRTRPTRAGAGNRRGLAALPNSPTSTDCPGTRSPSAAVDRCRIRLHIRTAAIACAANGSCPARRRFDGHQGPMVLDSKAEHGRARRRRAAAPCVRRSCETTPTDPSNSMTPGRRRPLGPRTWRRRRRPSWTGPRRHPRGLGARLHVEHLAVDIDVEPRRRGVELRERDAELELRTSWRPDRRTSPGCAPTRSNCASMPWRRLHRVGTPGPRPLRACRPASRAAR